jgi:hypothetical protein
MGSWWPSPLVLFFLALAAPQSMSGASSLSVEPGTVAPGDSVEITVRLEGSFASLDQIQLPLRGFRIEGGPSTSSQFQWINGTVSRHKTFRYTAVTTGPGVASAGPVVLRDESGRTLVLPQVDVTVRPPAPLPPGASGAAALAGRDLLFILPEMDRSSATVGQEINVTWYLYTAVPVRDLHLAGKPALEDFWSEEIPLDEGASTSMALAGRTFRKIAIRNAAIFPLRAGHLVIGSLDVFLDVMKPQEDPFGISIFEGAMMKLRRQSPTLAVDVALIPAGAPVQAVGSYSFSCTPPRVSASGPVVVEVTVSGRGNLRGAAPPQFEGATSGSVSIEDGGVSVRRQADGVTMTHRWKLLLFPRSTGAVMVPPVVFHAWNPEKRVAERLRCGGGSVAVSRIQAPPSGSPHSSSQSIPEDDLQRARLIVFGIVSTGALLLAVFLLRRRRRDVVRPDPEVISVLVAPIAQTRELRQRLARVVFDRGFSVAALEREATPLGEAYRSVSSWIEAEGRAAVGEAFPPEDFRGRVERLALELERARPR